MDDASDEQAAERDVDHLLGDVETGLVVAHEAPIAGEPTEGAFDHPGRGTTLKPGSLSVRRMTSKTKSRKAA